MQSVTSAKYVMREFMNIVEARNVVGLLPVTPQNIAAAKSFVFKKWVEREREDHEWKQEIYRRQNLRSDRQQELTDFVPPEDVSNGCKFSSYFASIIFGGRMVGNYDHYFVMLPGGVRFDLNDEAQDVRDMLAKHAAGEGLDPYRVDDIFMHQALSSDRRNVAKRVTEWLNQFCEEQGLSARFTKTSSGVIKKISEDLDEGRFDAENEYVDGASKTATEYANQFWYHGSEDDLADFNGESRRYFGTWFAANPKLTGYYGANQYKVKLHFQNPLIVSEQEYADNKPKGPTYWAGEAAKDGHDAVIIEDIIDGDTLSTICGVIDTDIIELVDKDIYKDDLEEANLPLRKGVMRGAVGNYGALIVVMDPKDFIRLTTSDKAEYNRIFNDKFATLADYRNGGHPEFNKSQYNMPFLRVNYTTGKVTGHEGRHRAAMVAKEGGTRFPCYLMFDKAPDNPVTISYVRNEKWDGEDEKMEQSFPDQKTADAFEAELVRLRDDADHPYWYSSFESTREYPTRMKGSPRSNPNKWEYDAWKPEDIPNQLVGQYDNSIVVPKSRLKVGIVKGHSHFK